MTHRAGFTLVGRWCLLSSLFGFVICGGGWVVLWFSLKLVIGSFGSGAFREWFCCSPSLATVWTCPRANWQVLENNVWLVAASDGLGGIWERLCYKPRPAWLVSGWGHLARAFRHTEGSCYLFGVCGLLRDFRKVCSRSWGWTFLWKSLWQRFRLSVQVVWGRVKAVSWSVENSDLAPTYDCRLDGRGAQQRKNGIYQNAFPPRELPLQPSHWS